MVNSVVKCMYCTGSSCRFSFHRRPPFSINLLLVLYEYRQYLLVRVIRYGSATYQATSTVPGAVPVICSATYCSTRYDKHSYSYSYQ